MNRIHYAIFASLLLLIIGCCNLITEISPEVVNNTLCQQYQVSINDIKAHFMKNGSLMTKNSSNEITVEPYVWEGDTVMFLVNDSKGWQLFSADKRACPIVAYAEDEHLSIQELQGPTMLNEWISSVAKDIHTLKCGNYPVENENTRYWDYVEGKASSVKTKSLGSGWRLIYTLDVSHSSTEIDHLIPTKWGSHGPWNDCFPEDVFGETLPVGSPNVAIAQMLYWSNQQNGIPVYSYTNITTSTGEHLYNDGESYYYNTYPIFSFNDSSSVAWGQMKTHYNSSGSSDYVGYLMAKVRSLTNLLFPEDYNLSTIVCALNYFQLQASSGNYSAETVVQNLLQGVPAILLMDVETNGYVYDTHVCIADSYYRYATTYEEFYIYDPYNTFNGEIEIEIEDPDPEDIIAVLPDGYEWCSQQNMVSFRYLSCNWGNNGIGDNSRYSVYSTLWDWVNISTTSVSPWKMVYNIHTIN